MLRPRMHPAVETRHHSRPTGKSPCNPGSPFSQANTHFTVLDLHFPRLRQHRQRWDRWPDTRSRLLNNPVQRLTPAIFLSYRTQSPSFWLKRAARGLATVTASSLLWCSGDVHMSLMGLHVQSISKLMSCMQWLLNVHSLTARAIGQPSSFPAARY